MKSLLRGIVDYAGLFPPARLELLEAVENYDRYRNGEHAWMLGRFILPVVELGSFEQVVESLRPWRERGAWRVSVLSSGNIDEDVGRIKGFNARHARGVRPMRIDSVEHKPSGVDSVVELAKAMPAEVTSYHEVTLTPSLVEIVSAIRSVGHRAKVRTGGVTADMFPSPDELLDFMSICHSNNVPFKATAGLHHPMRAEYRLTYEPDSVAGTMHGFLNVFLAAAFICEGAGLDVARDVLTEESAAAFRFDDNGIRWQDHRVDTASIGAIRDGFAVSFGSCSFDEPVKDLKGMHLI